MVPATFRIKNWGKIYEVSDAKRTGQGKPLSWVALPTKHDGRGYRRLMRRKEGLEVFAAFVLMVEVAAKLPERGTLADEDGPLTSDDLSDKTGADINAFEIAFQVLSDKQLGINWLEIVGDTSEYVGVAPPTYVRTIRTRRDDTGRDGRCDAGASQRGKARENKPTPDYQAFVNFFCSAWGGKYQAKYKFLPRDGKHVKWILAQLTLPKATSAIVAYLASTDKLIVQKRHDLGMFVSQFRTFTVDVAPSDPFNGEAGMSDDEILAEIKKSNEVENA